MAKQKKAKEFETRRDVPIDVVRMIPYDRHNFLNAEGVPSLGQREAYTLSTLALDEFRDDVTLVDPMCGNGCILMSAGLHFPGRIHHLFGIDSNPNTVLIARLNLGEMADMSESKHEQFPGYHILEGNAFTSPIPRAGYKTVVVADLPTKKFGYVDAEQRRIMGDFDTPVFLRHMAGEKIMRVILSADTSFDPSVFEKTEYAFQRALTEGDRDFYIGRIRKSK